MTLGMRSARRSNQRSPTPQKTALRRLILDLSGVEFIDSAGLGALMILYGNMKLRGGQLRLVAPGPKVLEVLRLTRTDSILPIDPNLEASLAA